MRRKSLHRVYVVTLLALMLGGLWACSDADGDSNPADGDTPGPTDGDSDGDETDPDGDTDPDPVTVRTGSGTCEDPFVHPISGDTEIFDETGNLDEVVNSVDPDICGDDGAGIDGGVEVVTKIALSEGDHLSITFYGETIDGTIYIRRNVCATSSGCEKLNNRAPAGSMESLTYTATQTGNYFIIMDTNLAQPGEDDLYYYHIEVIRAGDDRVAGEGKIGAPCKVGYECESSYCMTSDNLRTLIGEDDLTVENGYCAALFCHMDGSDGTCTEAMGGVCMSISPFYDYQFEGMGVCTRPCESDADCRTEDNMRCFDPQRFVELGLIGADIKERYFGDTKTCLPSDLIDEAITGIN